MAKTPKNQEGAPLLETVTLIRHHTHAGIDRKPGDIIDVTPLQKNWLMQHSIISNDTPTTGA
jgi:hypothetical protein